MKCMILAAGLGERLRPLTNNLPKPLIELAGKPLIEYHLEKLKLSGFEQVVINLSYLGEKIKKYLGNGDRFDLQIEYSDEGDEPLETAGGIINALPLLGSEPFLVINSDIWCDHKLSFANLHNEKHAHLVLIDNPAHNSNGDFAYEFGNIYNQGKHTLTYSGIGVYHPLLFKEFKNEKLPLAPILRNAIDNKLVSAEYFSGKWFDIGTIDRLDEANRHLAKKRSKDI